MSVSPIPHINFVSNLYSGSISDKELTKQCGFIEQLNAGDVIMADKGFNVQDLLAPKHVRLLAPPVMTKGKISSKARTMTRRIATVRVHVERMIRKLKCFELIRGVIPLTLKPYASSIIRVSACLVNLNPIIINEDDEKCNPNDSDDESNVSDDE